MPGEQLVTLERFKIILGEQSFPRRIDEIVVHHTWKPTASEYRGILTVRGVRLYHMRVRGWSDNGYHVMIAPNKDIYLCRPMYRSGAHVKHRNAHTIGVSYIADFATQDPAIYEGFRTGQMVVAALCQRHDLQAEHVRFHREFAEKSSGCPGWNVELDEYQEAVHVLITSSPPEYDVAPWAQPAVDWAQEEGLLVGKTDGLFHGYDPASRQELAVFAYRFQEWQRRAEVEDKPILKPYIEDEE